MIATPQLSPAPNPAIAMTSPFFTLPALTASAKKCKCYKIKILFYVFVQMLIKLIYFFYNKLYQQNIPQKQNTFKNDHPINITIYKYNDE